MKKEFTRLKKLSSKIITKDNHKKLKKIPHYVERTEGLKYMIASYLKLKLLELELESRGIAKKKVLLVESKLTQLSSKIKIFESTHSERDYKVIQKLIQDIEREIKCLIS